MSQKKGDPPRLEPNEEGDPPVLRPVEEVVGCPRCGEPMQLFDVDEVTVDVCSRHGIWLDLGEDELLLRRARKPGRARNREKFRRARRRGYARGYMEAGVMFSTEGSRGLRKRLARNRRAYERGRREGRRAGDVDLWFLA
jgi:Zn-finger nucleic acid-binding protein